jgi:TnpA family transposase
MPRLTLLTKAEQKKFDSSPQLNQQQKQKFFALNDEVEDWLYVIRKPINKVGFLLQLGYFRASGKFFPHEQFRAADIKFVCELLNISFEEISISSTTYNLRDKSSHRKMILDNLGWKELDEKILAELKNELIIYARKQLYPKTLLPIATQFLLHRNIELPPYYVLLGLISNAYNEAEGSLINIVDNMLTEKQKDILDDIICIDDKRRKHYKYSCLAKIKQMILTTKLRRILDSIETYKLIKEFYNTFSNVYAALKLSENATQYYATWVQKSKLFQLKQFKNRAKAHLYLLAYMQQQYYTRTDVYVDIILKIISTTLNSIRKENEKKKSATLQAQSEALKKISKSYKTSSQVLYDINGIIDDNSINNDNKITVVKGILNDFINSNDKLSDNDKEKITNLINYKGNSTTEQTNDYKTLAASLDRKLAPIIQIIEFDKITSDKNIIKAIDSFAGSSAEKMYDKTWMTEHETAIAFNSANNKANVYVYKGILFNKIYNHIKAGKLNLLFSYRYLPIKKYFIDDDRWNTTRELIIDSIGLRKFTDLTSLISHLCSILEDKFTIVNEDHTNGVNKHLTFTKTGRFKIATPGKKKITEESPIAPILSKVGIVSIIQVLNQINSITQFTKCFKHHANKQVKMKPSSEMIYAGMLSKGCNHGMRKMANISKGITEDKLKNTINWFFSLENIQAANNKNIAFLNNLSLPNIYKYDPNINHTSSDGQKINVSVDSILANYSFKYFGTKQGVSIYSFIDSRQILFYDTVISPTEREAAYVIDGLMANDVIRSNIHSTDTHGYSEIIFAITHLLGISFAPRIKKVGAQKLYSIDTIRKYPKKEFKIRPNHKINLALIEEYWDDILRFIATIKTKTTTASQLLKRLNSHTKEHPLYKALKEFGRIIKSIYILTYIDSLSLRQQIYKQLNRIELSNKFSKAVLSAQAQEFKTGATAEQILIVACKSFIQNCVVLWNYLYLSQALLDAKNEQSRKRLLLLIKQNSVISWRHINLQGEYDFTVANNSSYNSMFDLEAITKLKVA